MSNLTDHSLADGFGRLEGKRIVVTGAARGIGLSVVKLALDLGAKVVAIDMDEEESCRIAEQQRKSHANLRRRFR